MRPNRSSISYDVKIRCSCPISNVGDIKGVPPDFAYSSQYLPNLAYRLNRPRRIYWYQQFFSKVRGSKDTRGQAVFQCNQVQRLFDIDREVHLHIFDMPGSDMTSTSFLVCKLSLYFIFSLCFRVRNNVKKRPFKLNDFLQLHCLKITVGVLC